MATKLEDYKTMLFTMGKIADVHKLLNIPPSQVAQYDQLKASGYKPRNDCFASALMFFFSDRFAAEVEDSFQLMEPSEWPETGYK